MARKSGINVPGADARDAAVDHAPRRSRDSDDGGNRVAAADVNDQDMRLLINCDIFGVTGVIQICKARCCRKYACDGAAAERVSDAKGAGERQS